MTVIVIVGGGIAAISCLESLFQDYDAEKPQYSKIILISNTRLVKRIVNYGVQGRAIERFDVDQADLQDILSTVPQGLEFEAIIGHISSIDGHAKIVHYNPIGSSSNYELQYNILALAVGSSPIKLQDIEVAPELADKIVVIRDTTSIKDFRHKLESCRRLVVVGNGGISMELVTRVTNCDRFWIIRDKSIGGPFLDPGAAKFLLEASIQVGQFAPTKDSKRIDYSSDSTQSLSQKTFGPSLGPNWTGDLDFCGSSHENGSFEIIMEDEVASIKTRLEIESDKKECGILVQTKNSKREINCDMVAVAIGVKPNLINIKNGNLDLSQLDGGILIDEQMRTSLDQVYAAGDVVSCDKWRSSDLWFQMRLWTQARQMGYYMGKCIEHHIRMQNPMIYHNFECFTHATSFFGFRLVLLGRYNAQGLVETTNETRLDMVVRVRPGRDYVKVLISPDGLITGALLLGDSGLEETIENLIHDRIDVSAHKEHLLDDIVDIEDYFD